MVPQQCLKKQSLLLEIIVLGDLAIAPSEITRNFDLDLDMVYAACEHLHDRGLIELVGARCYESTPEGESKAIIRGSDVAKA